MKNIKVKEFFGRTRKWLAAFCLSVMAVGGLQQTAGAQVAGGIGDLLECWNVSQGNSGSTSGIGYFCAIDKLHRDVNNAARSCWGKNAKAGDRCTRSVYVPIFRHTASVVIGVRYVDVTKNYRNLRNGGRVYNTYTEVHFWVSSGNIDGRGKKDQWNDSYTVHEESDTDGGGNNLRPGNNGGGGCTARPQPGTSDGWTQRGGRWYCSRGGYYLGSNGGGYNNGGGNNLQPGKYNGGGSGCGPRTGGNDGWTWRGRWVCTR